MVTLIVKAADMQALRLELLKNAAQITEIREDIEDMYPTLKDQAAIMEHFIAPNPIIDDAFKSQFKPVVAQEAARPVQIPVFPHVAPLINPTIIPSAPSPSPTGALDSKGTPWDERCHSSSKAINRDGTWRARRGIETTELMQIENELRSAAKLAAPTNTPAYQPTVPPVPPQQFVQQPVIVPATPSIPQGLPPQAAVAPVDYNPIQVPPGQKPAHSLETFKKDFIKIFVHFLGDGKITPEWCEQLKAHFGVKETWDIAKNPTQVEETFNMFVQYGLVTRVG
jgi:hypothetical protein